MSTEFIKVTINGDELQVAKGSRLIDVCNAHATNVPSFCYYKDLELQASCRMCLVRIEKMPKLQTSCTIICTDGMVVTTESEEVRKAQRGMMEFLLANHPLDCPVCDRGGECELQETAMDWGDLEQRFGETKTARPERYLSPVVANDPQRCILCKRCTRVCDEWMGEEVIESENRGSNTVIGTMGGWLNCSQCGNCIEVCPTGTLLDGTYRHQTRPWELTRTVSTCTFCSDGCQMSLGSRGDELMRIVARDRYVNGHNGEFLCIKGRFAHPFVNHAERIKTPLIRYKKGGKLIPATWTDALRFIAQKLDQVAEQYGPAAFGFVATPRATNESLFAFHKFAAEVVGTNNITGADAFSLQPFFDNLGGPLATHIDIRHAQTVLLIGGEPEELQPFAGKQIRQAVRNGGAKLLIVNSVPIRLKQSAAQFAHIRPGSEDAIVLALANSSHDGLAADKAGITAGEIAGLRETLATTHGNVVILFGEEISPAAQAILAQLPETFNAAGRTVSLQPLPLYNNSIGLHDTGFMSGKALGEIVGNAAIKALYLMGSLLSGTEKLAEHDFVVVQEMFQTDTTAYADVVLPAASFAEMDGSYTNSGGLVQRVRQSIPPFNQARADWLIIEQLAQELGVDLGFQRSASTIFRELTAQIPAYNGLSYASLKDESHPAQARHPFAKHDIAAEMEALQVSVNKLDISSPKINETPAVGHRLFTPGVLTGKTPQFGYLAEGNEMPETRAVSPLYQITLDGGFKQKSATALAD